MIPFGGEQKVSFESAFPCAAQELFSWHERPGALNRLTPPWEQVELLEHSGITDGSTAKIKVTVGPIPIVWTLKHSEYQRDLRFVDTQIKGPFKSWRHEHDFQSTAPLSTTLRDTITFSLPAGVCGRVLGSNFVHKKLSSLFAYRHRTLLTDLEHHRHKPKRRILVSGSHGLIGRELVPFLTSGDHTVIKLVRSTPASPHDIEWNPRSGKIPHAAQLEGCDAVVHLAGEPIAARRWSTQQKEKILTSRTEGTATLCRALAALTRPPRVLVVASGVNYYGTTRQEILTEESAPGESFLANVCRQWEAACEPAREAGIRVVNLRFGVVLSPRGGALEKLLLPVRFQLGGPAGDGTQMMSWISLRDVVYLIYHSIFTESLSGPVNAVAPTPATNEEFMTQLGNVLNRATFVRAPKAALIAAYGELAQETIFANLHVKSSAQLEKTGFTFLDTDLKDAFRHMLGKITWNER